jgi:hypothetical protein
MPAERPRLHHRDLAERPGPSRLDSPPWSLVLRALGLEPVEDVLSAHRRPQREQSMVGVREGPSPPDRHEAQVADLIGDRYDNSMIESFWSRMQVELLDRKKWNTRRELANATFHNLEIWHNRQRPSQPARLAHTRRGRTQPHHHRRLRIHEIATT